MPGSLATNQKALCEPEITNVVPERSRIWGRNYLINACASPEYYAYLEAQRFFIAGALPAEPVIGTRGDSDRGGLLI